MNNTSTTRGRRIAVLSTVAAAALVTVPLAGAPADAKGRVVSNTNSCATGVIKVKAKADNGRLEVEGAVDTNRRGQTWAWTILRNGNAAASGTGTTAGPSGSFSVVRRIANPAGADRIVFRATRGAQVCHVGVTF